MDQAALHIHPLKKFFHFFTGKLRLSNPWKYKVPFLICIPYLIFLAGDYWIQNPIVTIVASISIIVGVAGIGYLTNDLGDRKKDALIGKQNATSGLTRLQTGFLVCFFLALLTLPWLYLPFNYNSLLLLCLQLLLFCIYAFPPFRFKEKGALGVLTDALYAHLIPAILASYTFFQLIQTPTGYFWVFLFTLSCWQFILGTRNIIFHQIKDAQNDLNSNTKTFVNTIGVTNAEKLCARILLPLECMSFMGFVITVSRYNYLFGTGIIFFFVVSLLKHYRQLKTLNYRGFAYLFLDDLYIKWTPVFVLILLCFKSPVFIALLILHFFIFQNGLKTLVMDYMQGSVALRKTRSFFFEFNTFKQGLRIHLTALLVYSLLFILCYFLVALKNGNQLLLSRMLVLTMVTHALLLLSFRKQQCLQFATTYFNEKGQAFNLATFRIIFFFFLSMHFWLYVIPKHSFWASMPHSSRVGLPFIGWLIDVLPITEPLFFFAGVAAGLFSLLVCIGFCTRISLILLLPFAAYAIAIPMFFGKISHQHFLLWVLLLLCLSPVHDVLSVDAWLKKKRGLVLNTEPSIKYLLPFKFTWLILATIYFFAGIVKLWDCGLDWALSDSMINQIRWEWVEHYDTVPGFRLDNYPAIAKVGGLLVIYFELLYFLLIFSPKSRIWALLSAITFHKICGYFMYIDFKHLQEIGLSYINWQKLFSFFTKKPGSPVTDGMVSEPQVSLFKNLKKNKLMPTFIIGISVLSLVFLCSAFRIHSFPFSSYPTYSALVPGNITVLRMEATDVNGEIINIRKLGADAQFRWENIRPYELRIAETFKKHDTTLLDMKLKEYWDLWEKNIPDLQKAKQVKFYLDTYPIEPEKRNILLDSVFVGVITPAK